MLIRHIAEALPGAGNAAATLTDLGCGTGASGAAWASVCSRRPAMVGIDRHPWAVDEARHTYRMFGLHGRTHVGDASRVQLAGRGAVLAAFTLNEMDAAARDALMSRFLAHGGRGGSVLVVEPLAGFVAPWWATWRHAFESAGGRADEWRVRAELPPIVQKLDRAAGLNHREVTGRSLWLTPR
jgi:ubiquinone/menaquinone biosynthesis C-methylase UbiE